MSFSRSDSFRDIDFTLRRSFGKEAFRPLQRLIITEAMDGKDVFVQAATSFGKSLCFQLPAVIEHGITIVVCPLLSLMTDQVTALRKLGIEAHSLNSNTPMQEKHDVHSDLETGHPLTRLLYVTPEHCSHDSFRNRLKLVYQQKELARIAVDEAHCISEWGHDFRKDYKRLSWFRESFPDVPIMCLTATATAQVRDDVLSTLGMDRTPERLKTFTTSAYRPNIHLEVRFTDNGVERYDDFVTWLQACYQRRREPARKAELDAESRRLDNVSGIIYTISRQECETLAVALRQEGIGARPYHTMLSKEEKEKTLARWVGNEVGFDVIVATTAFGMGIDKKDVRFVVHWRMPKSFEGYYQELGRAGRDGLASYCFLYYSREDRDRMRGFLVQDSPKDGPSRRAREASLDKLIEYCENTTTCRHASLCKYFGEAEVPKCDFACDWHKDAEGLKRRLREGLSCEENVSTQMEEGFYDDD